MTNSLFTNETDECSLADMVNNLSLTSGGTDRNDQSLEPITAQGYAEKDHASQAVFRDRVGEWHESYYGTSPPRFRSHLADIMDTGMSQWLENSQIQSLTIMWSRTRGDDFMEKSQEFHLQGIIDILRQIHEAWLGTISGGCGDDNLIALIVQLDQEVKVVIAAFQDLFAV